MPKHHAVYVLTSNGNDLYSRMTLLSVRSLKFFNPNIRVSVLTDESTLKGLQDKQDPLFPFVDEFIVQKTDLGSNFINSRFLKANCRNFVSGSFLLLDIDTLIRSNIEEIFEVTDDIAACPNHSQDQFDDQVAHHLELIYSLGWKLRTSCFVNTGIVLFNDTPAATNLGRLWSEMWFDHRLKTNHDDQNVFNAALYRSECSLRILPHRYNAQVRARISVSPSASIWHFYANANIDDTTEFDELIEMYARGEEVKDSTLKNILSWKYPWRYLHESAH